MDPDETFASRSVPVHVVRGVLGLSLLVAAFVLIEPVSPAMLLLAIPAVVLLRGCPTCWALGLAQTRARVSAARSEEARSGGPERTATSVR